VGVNRPDDARLTTGVAAAGTKEPGEGPHEGAPLVYAARTRSAHVCRSAMDEGSRSWADLGRDANDAVTSRPSSLRPTERMAEWVETNDRGQGFDPLIFRQHAGTPCSRRKIKRSKPRPLALR